MARAPNTTRTAPAADAPASQRLDLPDHAAPPAKHPGGRPPVWTPERIAEAQAAILDQLADGQSMRTICRQPDMPSWSTVREWLRSSPEFATQHARAREAAADMSAARVIEIAEAVANGEMDPQAGRTAIDGHKWAAAKLNARVYGDRIDVTASVNVNQRVGWVIDLAPTEVLDGTAVSPSDALPAPDDPQDVVAE